MGKKYTFEDLKQIMETLRSEQGCPWDREQSHESLLQYLLEETYEVIDAVKKNDMEHLCEELGDVLLQVMFHAQIASEKGQFQIDDVVDRICKKMIHRHTHIFSDEVAKTAEEVKQNWEKIKKLEKGFETQTEVLKDIPEVLPALVRATKVQAKASEVGFDWEGIEGPMEKLKEEWDELKEAYRSNQKDKIIEEYGDFLFSNVNIGRFLKINPEFALTKSIEKFINRFEYIERAAIQAGKHLNTMSLAEMDQLWEKAKEKRN